MKVLFVNPYIYDFTAFDLWLRPLGNMYLASVVEKFSDAEVFWIDTLDRFIDDCDLDYSNYGKGKYHREVVEKPIVYSEIPRTYARYGLPVESFRNKLDNLDEIDIIFITTLMTYWIDGVNFTVNELRKRFRKAKIVVGGILPTLVGKSIKNHIEGDIFITGYGESKILNLLSSFGCNVMQHPDFSDIDNIPFPLHRFLSYRKALPLLTSRGCPYRCTYCASPILNKNFVQRSPENITHEILQMNNEYGTEDFIIFDDAFLINKENRFFPVFKNIRNRIDIRFHTPNGIHAKEVDGRTADLLYQAGFETIRLSFESTDEEILQKSSDKITVHQMEKAVDNLLRAGFNRSDIECYILFGFPGLSHEKLEKSLKFVKKLGILPRLSFYSPVPGTIEFNNLRAAGMMSGDDYLYRTNKIYFLYKYSGFSVDEINYYQNLTKEICNSANSSEN